MCIISNEQYILLLYFSKFKNTNICHYIFFSIKVKDFHSRLNTERKQYSFKGFIHYFPLIMSPRGFIYYKKYQPYCNNSKLKFYQNTNLIKNVGCPFSYMYCVYQNILLIDGLTFLYFIKLLVTPGGFLFIF